MVLLVESDDIHPAWIFLNVIGHLDACRSDAIIDSAVSQRSRMR